MFSNLNNRVLDKNTMEKVKYYKKLLAEKRVNEIIGTTSVYLDHNCMCAESNLANLIVDSYIQYVSIYIYCVVRIYLQQIKLTIICESVYLYRFFFFTQITQFCLYY